VSAGAKGDDGMSAGAGGDDGVSAGARGDDGVSAGAGEVAAVSAGAKREVLTLEGLTVARGGRNVVREVSLEIPAGEVTALLGPNGAGKSSMVLAIGGVLKPVAGKVLLEDQNFAGRRPERIRGAGIAIVPEGRRLLPELTVGENLRVATYTLSAGDAEAGRARALELFPELEKRLDYPARALSGGEQQMVVLAQALVSHPRFVIIDELSLGLAPVVVNRLVPTIRSIAEAGIGVLLIEQFVTVALGLANRAYVMEGGRIRFSGMARELRENPELLQSAYLLRSHPPRNGADRSAAPAAAEPHRG
jgi:branched-chain amino acid transport system ATP-binding protein